jgi:hypothetical protein
LESNAVLVLRYKHKGETKTRVWRGCTAYHVIKSAYAAATRVSEGRNQKAKAWPPRADAYVKENYSRFSKSQIAAELTAKYKRKYTKNMVISRYHRIKNK